jgi:PAS domain S-box-containing protein
MSSLPDSGLSIRDLEALFDQSPIALVFNDRDLRTRRTNAAFRRMVGLPDEALIGRRPSEIGLGADAARGERTVAEQVIGKGLPVIDMHVERTVAGQRRVLSWSAYRVTDNGRVLGVLGSFSDVTDRAQVVTALRQANARLRQANARLDLLERAASQIGTMLDIRRTAGELADLACLRGPAFRNLEPRRQRPPRSSRRSPRASRGSARRAGRTAGRTWT